MIVKNEGLVIEKCLGSLKHLIDYWVIVDTGSTDGTQRSLKIFSRMSLASFTNALGLILLITGMSAETCKGKGDYLL